MRNPNRPSAASLVLLAVLLAPMVASAGAAPEIQPLSTAVIKATTGLCHKGIWCHVNNVPIE